MELTILFAYFSRSHKQLVTEMKEKINKRELSYPDSPSYIDLQKTQLLLPDRTPWHS